MLVSVCGGAGRRGGTRSKEKSERYLSDVTDLAPVVGHVQGLDVVSIEMQAPRRGVVEAKEELCEAQTRRTVETRRAK